MGRRRKPNRQSKSYKTWADMKWRCKKLTGWADRGITVCERWQSFDNFFADMGHHPDGMTLDRIDNDGPYSPDNCRWADSRTQSNNRRTCKQVTFKGQTLTVAQWARKLDMPHATIWGRLFKQGWSVERTLTTPNST